MRGSGLHCAKIHSMNPVRSFGSPGSHSMGRFLHIVEQLLFVNSKSEAQASYLPAKARSENVVWPSSVNYLYINQANLHRGFGRWQAGF